MSIAARFLLYIGIAQSYHREVARNEHGDIPKAVRALLPRLRSDETAVLILTLAETTPVAESLRLEQDLSRAGVPVAAWIINRSFARIGTESPLIAAKAKTELPWIHQVAERHPELPIVILPWLPEQLAGTALVELLA